MEGIPDRCTLCHKHIKDIWLVANKEYVRAFCNECYRLGQWRNPATTTCYWCGKSDNLDYKLEVVFTVFKFASSRLHCSWECYDRSKKEAKIPELELKQLCENCGKMGKLLVCSRCRLAHYCSGKCQSEHYPKHRPDCLRIASQNPKERLPTE